MREQWRAYGSYLAALSIFLSSRLTMALAILFSARLVPQNTGLDSFINATPSWCTYLTRTGGVLGFQSMMRYMLLAFPVFIVAGLFFKERLWLGLSVVGICAAMLFMYRAMYAQWYWVG